MSVINGTTVLLLEAHQLLIPPVVILEHSEKKIDFFKVSKQVRLLIELRVLKVTKIQLLLLLLLLLLFVFLLINLQNK
jgi:hypothetical protein